MYYTMLLANMTIISFDMRQNVTIRKFAFILTIHLPVL